MTLVVSETQQVLRRLNLDILSFISAWLIRHRFTQENFMSRCCINFTLQLMQLKHISDLSVFKATNKAVEIRLKNSDRFLYMQHISGRQLSIYCKLQANGNTCYFVLTLKYVPSDQNNAPVQGLFQWLLLIAIVTILIFTVNLT